jgi:SPP1 family predicted phage head-tail adaptor
MKCCDMKAGMLKEAVAFQRLTRTSDGAGGFTEAWAAIVGTPTRAHVKAMSGGERWHSDRVEASATHKIVVRYNSSLTTKDRVVIRGLAYNIRFIDNMDMADKWLYITAQVGVAV